MADEWICGHRGTCLVSMRNRLTHGYFDVDHDIVWRTATEEITSMLPVLRATLEAGMRDADGAP